MATRFAATGHDDAKALRHYRAALSKARRLSRDNDVISEIHRWLAEFWIERGVVHYAELHLNRALSSETTMELEDRLALDRIRSEILSLNGEHEESLAALQAHIDEVRRKGLPFEELLTARALGVVSARLGREDFAAFWWEQARTVAAAIGSSALVERWVQDPQQTTSRVTEPKDRPRARHIPEVDLALHGILTRSAALRETGSQLALIAPTRVPVLIRGESGTGKELFAKLVHVLSGRPEGKYLTVNCGGFPPDLIESELFGHRRGSFTGAVADKRGLFTEADGGSLFLDEIGELPPVSQAKLLRVLENGEIRPVGGTQIEHVDVRIVAATNVELERAVLEGRFREDLYYRLSGMEVVLPPLRERLSDIPVLAGHFLDACNTETGKSLTLPVRTERWLIGQDWPGNVRQLKLAIHRAAALAPVGGELLPEDFRRTDRLPSASASLPDELVDIERERIRNALEASRWNTAAAARILNMSRTTLTGRIKRLGIEKPS